MVIKCSKFFSLFKGSIKISKRKKIKIYIVPCNTY